MMENFKKKNKTKNSTFQKRANSVCNTDEKASNMPGDIGELTQSEGRKKVKFGVQKGLVIKVNKAPDANIIKEAGEEEEAMTPYMK